MSELSEQFDQLVGTDEESSKYLELLKEALNNAR